MPEENKKSWRNALDRVFAEKNVDRGDKNVKFVKSPEDRRMPNSSLARQVGKIDLASRGLPVATEVEERFVPHNDKKLGAARPTEDWAAKPETVAMPTGFRQEPTGLPAAPSAAPRAAVSSEWETVANPQHRLLIGHGSLGAEARVRLDAGPLAGTEIRFVGRGQTLSAQILAQSTAGTAKLEQTLKTLSQRLHRKGISLNRGDPGDKKERSRSPYDE